MPPCAETTPSIDPTRLLKAKPILASDCQRSNIAMFRPSECLEVTVCPFLALRSLLQVKGSRVEPHPPLERINAF
jgi:hypothetical protein